MDLREWTIFSLLSQPFLRRLKMVCVFGNLGNEALLVTKEDEVYALGSNASACHGVGDQEASLVPRKVDALCGKGIIQIDHGCGPHVLACTESGELYAWGHNGYCQLGNGSTNASTSQMVTIPAQVHFPEKKVIEVACGSHHSLALTEEGEVFAWGQNNFGQVGSGTTTNQPLPRRVGGALTERAERVKAICAGQTSSFAVTEAGEVFSWGNNGNGQLGLGSSGNQPMPSRVPALSGVYVIQVTCGYAHTLALCDDGAVYAWGANSYGQLGTGNKNNSSVPVKVCTKEVGRVVELGASHSNHLSAAQTQNLNVWMWGQCRGQSVLEPYQTELKSMHTVFASFGSPAVTFRPMAVEVEGGPTITESMALAFNDEETSDVKFLVDNSMIYAHRCFLRFRCQHFRAMFSDQWVEAEKDVIPIEQFSYAVYYAFIKYLYTDTLDLNVEDAIGVLDLANAYCDESLKMKCIRILRNGITVDNAAHLYSIAIRYHAPELEDFAFNFCIHHMTKITQTEAFSGMEKDIIVAFVVKAGNHGAFKH